MAYKINGTTVVDNSRNVCACCVTSCCITASTRMDVPSGTTAQRPSSPATGSIYFDTDLGSLVSYDGAAWAAVGGGAGLDIEDLVSNKTDAWSFTVTDTCPTYCRSYRSCCGGCLTPLLYSFDTFPAFSTSLCVTTDLPYMANGSCCPKFFNPNTSRCRNNLLCVFQCLCALAGASSCNFFSCFNTARCGGLSGFICPRFSFPITPNIYGQARQPAYIGEVPLAGNHCVGSASDVYFGRYAELFFNAKGGSTIQFSTCLQPYLTCNSSPASFAPFGYFNTPRYFANSYFGEVAFIRTPLGFNDILGGSCNIACCAFYVITEDTYGTGLEETCDYATISKGQPNLCSFYFPYSNTCSCLCFGSCFLYNSAASCSAIDGTPYIKPCEYCCPTQLCPCKINFFNSRVTPFLGGGVHCKDSFDACVCSYADGVCQAAFNGGCCSFGLVFWIGHGNNCLCMANLETQTSGVTFPSRDGCCIHRIYVCCMVCSATSVCCCRIDSGVTGTNACFGTYRRLYQTNINRINPAVVSHKGFCCVQFDDWECDLFGCVGGTHPKRQAHSTEMSKVETFTNTAVDPNYMKSYEPDQFALKYSSDCTLKRMNLDNKHHVVWSKACDRKAILMSPACCTAPIVALFDCCQDSLDLVQDLCIFNAPHFACNLIGAYAKKPCCMTGCSNAVKWLTGGTTTACWCTWRDCMCTLTGNPTLSLMHKCLGYSMDNNDDLNTAGIVPIGGDASFSTVHNRENDHVVLFRAIGFGPQGTCICKVTWMGAICWDIHNRCISKVNTIYPPSPDGALQYQRNDYWCDIECAKSCSSYVNGSNALEVNVQCYFRESFCCCHSTKIEGIRALPYGNVNSYRASGCTDLGGFYVAGGLGCCVNYPVTVCTCQQNPGSDPHYYYNCTALACGLCNTCGCVLSATPMYKYLAKVPFDKPLECVGFRSEPELAKMMNSLVAPACCSCYFTNLSALCSAGHKCLTLCACQGSFRIGPLASCQAITCFACGPYSSCDCIKWQKTVTVILPSTPLRFCHCAVTGGSTCCFTDTPFCCWTQFKGNCSRQSCALMYKCLQPCHFDKNETSKLKLYPYLETRAEVTTHNYSDKTNRISCRFVPLNEGEDPYERFHRQWNEDVIECC